MWAQSVADLLPEKFQHFRFLTPTIRPLQNKAPQFTQPEFYRVRVPHYSLYNHAAVQPGVQPGVSEDIKIED